MARHRSKTASAKGLPPKKTSVKAPASVKDDKLILLWMCLSHHSGEIDFDAVGAAYGISRNSAQQRFYRLRTYMTMQALPGKTAPVQAPTTDEEPLEEDNEVEEDSEKEDGDDF
ncbi:uncharacterized protein N7484_008949 [Penicillium longicatenatum]|uniref:uncharacterized protein n=1 Tax=Penicillium longicatenatum TaxID=1561947 RepID=UPI002547BCE9|nr:uncharacterized protein N7484_008949 [Penicillium longicatenatum]KAJ5635636.1 hypothetical protein N7484_008949 [Penicillium longicatenatum]